jgi:glycosyltransferase involved in cell wall biosynthesis
MNELAVVMPVYNEQDCIDSVVRSWLEVLGGLEIDFRIVVVNDGSSDDTGKVLEHFSGHPSVEVVTKPNGGHGPAILLGYGKALKCANWVFQCDSDDEISADQFPEFWSKRSDFDALIGIRSGRVQSRSRALISAISRWTVGLLLGNRVADVNAPFRLIRKEQLDPIVAAIPEDTFAPNLVISGALAKSSARIANIPVRHEMRKTGAVSIVKWGLWKAAAKSFVQTIRLRNISSQDGGA